MLEQHSGAMLMHTMSHADQLTVVKLLTLANNNPEARL